jgi:hypothetical protein
LEVSDVRNMGIVVIVGAIVVALGALLFGFWSGGWTTRDVKKAAGAAQKKVAQIKDDAEAAVHAATT